MFVIPFGVILARVRSAAFGSVQRRSRYRFRQRQHILEFKSVQKIGKALRLKYDPTKRKRVKVFDSGMPSESYWNSLFDIPMILDWLDLDSVGTQSQKSDAVMGHSLFQSQCGQPNRSTQSTWNLR